MRANGELTADTITNEQIERLYWTHVWTDNEDAIARIALGWIPATADVVADCRSRCADIINARAVELFDRLQAKYDIALSALKKYAALNDMSANRAIGALNAIEKLDDLERVDRMDAVAVRLAELGRQLGIAAALCEAFERGMRKQRQLDAWRTQRAYNLNDHWQPGCGNSAFAVNAGRQLGEL